MTTTATTNYGSTFKFNSVSYPAMVTDYPEISMGKAVSTNHSSGGVAESIPNGLLTLGDFSISIVAAAGNGDTLSDLMIAKTVAACIIEDDIEVWTFQGWITGLKKEAADANSPDTQKYTVTVAPTGGIVITAPV